MKRKFSISLIILITIVLFECKKEVSLTPDEKIFNSLIGTWRIEYINGYGLLEINKDLSFTQKTYFITNNNENLLEEIDEGTFKILNEKFVIESAKMTYFSDVGGCTTTRKNTILYNSNALELYNNKLKLSAIMEFKPVGENIYGSIFGKWECSSAIILVYDSFSEEKYFNGIYTELIELPANSTEYYDQGIIKYGKVVENLALWQKSYTFSNNIFVNEFDFKAIVSFDNGNMIWQCTPITYTKQ